MWEEINRPWTSKVCIVKPEPLDRRSNRCNSIGKPLATALHAQLRERKSKTYHFLFHLTSTACFTRVAMRQCFLRRFFSFHFSDLRSGFARAQR